MSEKRIYGENVNINHENVEKFYDDRAKRISEMKNPYSAVLLNDHNPEAVEKRMNLEKEHIFPRLKIDKYSKVLDIGCGIGRWGEEIIPQISSEGGYYGIDFSQQMIEVARKRTSRFENKNFKFDKMSFQEFTSDRKDKSKYNRVIMSGVIMYISDSDVFMCFKDLLAFMDGKCMIYIHEPCNLTERLTLRNFPSEALRADYNVIYRTKPEYDRLFSVLIDAGFFVSYSEYYSKLGGDIAFKENDRFYTIFERNVT